MKRLILVSALLCGFVCANSQTMYFWKNNVALAAEASALGVMQYTQNGTALTVVDSVMDLQNIDSITVGTPVDESTVRVDYSSNGATAVVPFSLSRKVAVSTFPVPMSMRYPRLLTETILFIRSLAKALTAHFCRLAHINVPFNSTDLN